MVISEQIHSNFQSPTSYKLAHKRLFKRHREIKKAIYVVIQQSIRLDSVSISPVRSKEI